MNHTTVPPRPSHSRVTWERRVLLAAAVIFAAALAWAVCDYGAAVRMKFYTGYFAYGRSLFQLYFYLGFMTIACVLQAYRPFRGFDAIPLRAVRALLLCMAICSIMGFSEFASALSVPWSQRVILFADGNVSSNSLQNIHVFKSALVVISGWLGLPTSISSGDNGAAYLQIVPGFVPIGGAIVLLTAGAVLLFNLGVAAPDEPDGPTAADALLRGAATFIWLKDFVDGGYLSPESMLAAAILARLGAGRGTQNRWHGLSPALAYGFALCAAAIGFLILFSDSAFEPFAEIPAWGTDLLAAAAAVFLLPSISRLVITRRLPALAWCGGFAALLVALRGSNPWLEVDYQNLFREIKKGTAYSVTLPYPVTGKRWTGEGEYFSMARVVAPQDLIPLEIYERYRLRPGIPYIAIEGKDCKLGLRPTVSAEVKVLRGSVDPTKLTDSTLQDPQLVMCKPEEWCTMRVYARLSSCVPLATALSEQLIMALSRSGAQVFGYRNESVWGRMSTVKDDE